MCYQLHPTPQCFYLNQILKEIETLYVSVDRLLKNEDVVHGILLSHEKE